MTEDLFEAELSQTPQDGLDLFTNPGFSKNRV